MTGHSKPKLIRWLKFNMVGGIGIGVQFAVLMVLTSGLHFNYLFATALAVELTVLHNFIWHERFTWRDRSGKKQTLAAVRRWPARLLRFNFSNGAVSIFGNLALMKILAGAGRVNYMLANGIAILVCSLVNFLVSEKWVFR